MSDPGPIVAPSIPRIGRADRARDDLSFGSLRALAIARAQAASGANWTDYNLHDPGVTILEAVCYALTELAYRADFSLADQLCGPDGQIDLRRQGLIPAEAIFPCRATTAADYRRVLLEASRDDPATALHDARFRTAAGGGDATGLLHLSLLRAFEFGSPPPSEAAPWAACVANAQAAYRAQRGLGEDLDETVAEITPVLCTLRLEAVVDGPRDPTDILAEIFDLSETFIAGVPMARTLPELLRSGLSPEEILTGPVTAGPGLIAETDLSGPSADSARPGLPPQDERSLSTLRTRLLAVDGVAAISRLTVTMDGGDPPQTRTLAWDGEVQAPRLRVPRLPEPGHPPTVDNVAITAATRLHRQGPRDRGPTLVHVDPMDVAVRFEDIRAGRAQGRAASRALATPFAPPAGAYRRVGRYDSIQNLFPRVYGLGREGLAADGTGGPAQLRAYLALFDQILANGGAQLSFLRDLFTPDVALTRSYDHVVLDDRDVPGIGGLYGDVAPDTVRRRVYDRFDDAHDRRNRVLDYLLSLYGETLAQDDMGHYLDYLDSEERAGRLLEIKVAYLKAIEVVTRDRAGGFDYAHPLWDAAEHTPGFQLRVCLQLGFRRPRARGLTTPLSDTDHAWTDVLGLADDLRPPVHHRHDPNTLRALSWPEGDRPRLDEAGGRDRRRQAPAPPDALFRLAVNRQRYRWRPPRDGRDGHLYLGPDPGPDGEARWWDLGAFESEAAAVELAQWLRHRMLALTDACEGLHVVEHILLRPRAETPPPTSLEALGLRVTLVAPAWTARTSRPDFQRFAEQTVAENSPAHLEIRCLWLGMGEMARFEELFARWARLLRDHSREPARARTLDAASAALLDFLARHTAATAASPAGGA